MMRPPGNDAGFTTVLAAFLVAGLVSLTVIVAGAATLVVGSHRAQVAADMAAVAGASELARGGDACTAAAETARHNDSRLDRCAVDERDVVVAAVVAKRTATARAGPL
ncbi:hypothetical protein CATYP_01390 [Corynebacterium atypicum]|uniref:TadE-like protein n=1 Tax=Corynebacterium atypicum TaxID=191610 RepID=A0ABN4DED6_9CORY|nr:Rv3654c family TadE-like protein [Corynebacterium atypicum]AIG63554.1 hypothetical protein CATYP_01390 [Corynebacterium atypicum]